MNKKPALIISLVLIFLLSLILYDFYQTRKTQLNAGPTLLPEIVLLESAPPQISWQIDSATPKIITKTAIYWGGESSSSALPTSASPEVVGYPFFTPDFIDAQITLPSQFSVNLNTDQPGKIYYRIYAQVDQLHLWSEEFSAELD